MTLTIQCEWDEGDLVAGRLEIEGKGIAWTWHENRKLYQSADLFLREVAHWQIEQNKRNVSP